MSAAAVFPKTEAAETPFARIDAALQRGATILAPNQRTARELLLRYDRARQAAGGRTWKAPNILSWGAWTASLWRTAIVGGIESRVLLNALQERELWRRIIDSDPAESIRPAASHAKLCEGAANLLGAYDVTGRFARGSYPLHALTADAERFAGWYAQFEERCRNEVLLPASHLAVELAAHLREGHVVPAGEYLLYGFGAPTPAISLVLEALEQTGATIRHMAAAVSGGAKPQLIRCASSSSEMRQCARWVREQLERNAGATVAVIVPDLSAVRGELERELRRAVAPHLSEVTAGEQAPIYEFSSGRPLDTLAMVQDALRLLRWCGGPVSLEDAGALLRSPYLRLAASPLRGAELDMHTVRPLTALRGEISMRNLVFTMQKVDIETTQSLRNLQSAARLLQREKGSHAAFADKSRGVLHTAGWPGANPLNNEERQALDRWEEALDRVATLDLLGTRTAFDAFVSTMATTAREMLFAPENTGAPVQVMTAPEAAGSTADALWFLHADENTWPPKQALHPLLPWTMQRELGMPGANARADEEAARESLQRILSSAGETVFSYSCTTADGAQSTSPLVLEIAPQTAAHAYGMHDEPPMLTEEHEDSQELPDLPEAVLSGGASVLTAQAQCGFRAFAERRLFAAPVDPREAGFTVMERGSHVHEVLQKFWNTVGSQGELIRMSASLTGGGRSERDVLLRGYIDELFVAEPQAAWDAAYIDVQRKRLFKLLTEWLDFEMNDRPSFTVMATEKEVADAQLGPLHLKLRVDRVDLVDANGSEGTILIDYKTGKAAAREWQGERPDAPQLPVYAIAGGLGQVDGLAFGAVKVGDDGMKLEGTAADPKLLGSRKTGSKEPFAIQLENWQRDLLKLAEAFAAGDASVEPKEYPKTCDRCAQRMLCRVDAATLLALDDPLDEEEEGGMPWV
jgi:ATP-dependent helicase/nuclease subunit B